MPSLGLTSLLLPAEGLLGTETFNTGNWLTSFSFALALSSPPMLLWSAAASCAALFPNTRSFSGSSAADLRTQVLGLIFQDGVLPACALDDKQAKITQDLLPTARCGSSFSKDADVCAGECTMVVSISFAVQNESRQRVF